MPTRSEPKMELKKKKERMLDQPQKWEEKEKNREAAKVSKVITLSKGGEFKLQG